MLYFPPKVISKEGLMLFTYLTTVTIHPDHVIFK